MSARCICGRSEAFGRVHTCPHPAGPSWAERPAVINNPAQPAVDNETVTHVINQASVAVTNSGASAVAKMEIARAALTGAERQAKWRASNRDKHRERSREVMRRARACRKLTTVPCAVENRG